ncbi:hypothetical protein ACFQ4C_30115 [Larkinella insperata]|uniref:DUF4369 domain-containing protein n=1 Tax=Larkinella insperata TaxID=332158 RepID=A0ABW3QJX0_9BACT
MRSLPAFALFLFLVTNVWAQNTQIAFKLFVKGELLKTETAVSVSVFDGKDTLQLTTDGSSFYLPDSLFSKRKTLLISINGFSLLFRQMPLGYNKVKPQWEIFLDYYPFMDDSKWLVKDKEGVKWYYSLINHTGSQFTFYRYKKLAGYERRLLRSLKKRL